MVMIILIIYIFGSILAVATLRFCLIFANRYRAAEGLPKLSLDLYMYISTLVLSWISFIILLAMYLEINHK